MGSNCGKKCAYALCGKSCRKNPGLRRYSFPVQDEERCKIWVKNSGNPKLLELSPQSLKKMFLCSSHFKTQYILTKGISTTAIPFEYQTYPSKLEMRTYLRKTCSVESDMAVPSTSGQNIGKISEGWQTWKNAWTTQEYQLLNETVKIKEAYKMEVKEEPVDSLEEIMNIKSESLVVDSQTKVKIEKRDWVSENPQISPTKLSQTVKEEPQDEGFFVSPLSNISEVNSSDYFVKPSDIIDIKQELSEYVEPKSELLTAHCDLPSMKCENLDYFDQPCSSKQAQELLEQSRRKRNAVKKVTKKKKYPCPICSKSFKYSSLRKKHISQHFETFAMCSCCGRFFNQEKPFLDHYFVHLTKMYYSLKPKNTKRSELTSEKTISIDFKKLKTQLKNQLKNVISNTEFQCKVCCQKFCNRYALTIHMKMIHTCKRLFHCEYCDKKFATHYYLKVHSKCHTVVKLLECEFCLRKFSTETAHRHHLLTHQKPIECEFCLRKFSTETAHRHHLLIHQKPIESEICFKQLYNKLKLKCHKSLPSKNIIQDKIRSKKSIKITKNKIRSKKSIKITQNHLCEICSAVFPHVAHLKSHMKSHMVSHTLIFTCMFCSSKFINQSELKEHLKIHQSDTYICKICSSNFETNKALSAHVALHLRQRQPLGEYECLVCAIKFDQKDGLEQHVTANKVPKDLKCGFCSETMALKCHEVVHTETGGFPKCYICFLQFRSKRALDYHHKNKHGNVGKKPKYRRVQKVDIDAKPWR